MYKDNISDAFENQHRSSSHMYVMKQLLIFAIVIFLMQFIEVPFGFAVIVAVTEHKFLFVQYSPNSLLRL